MKTDLTAPVEAAAKAAHAQWRKDAGALLPPKAAEGLPVWGEVDPISQNQWRQDVLPIVVAAIEAIPEPPGSDAWLQGLMRGPTEAD